MTKQNTDTTVFDDDREFSVSDWSDIDSIPELETREKERIAQMLTNDELDILMWIPQWIYEDKNVNIETLTATQHLLTGTVSDYSDDAWQVAQPHADTDTQSFFIPKSEVYVFRGGSGNIDSPQQKLNGF